MTVQIIMYIETEDFDGKILYREFDKFVKELDPKSELTEFNAVGSDFHHGNYHAFKKPESK